MKKILENFLEWWNDGGYSIDKVAILGLACAILCIVVVMLGATFLFVCFIVKQIIYVLFG